MSTVLDGINGPDDVKRLNKGELSELCSELREVLIGRVTDNGGHLASNLGAVELAVALHRVFDSPKDKIIWDVGHQSYIHKLLTGRKQQFSSLRTFGGISGFPDPDESQYDSFSTGHASTSISAGLGMAIARDLAGDDYNIISVIGDGGLTGGMSFEALNHAGHLSKNLIVVLTDNGMSISPTVLLHWGQTGSVFASGIEDDGSFLACFGFFNCVRPVVLYCRRGSSSRCSRNCRWSKRCPQC